MAQFERYIGIDYSGAQTPTSSLKGLRVYQVTGNEQAHEVFPPPSSRKYWTRRGIALWLTDQLAQDIPTMVGIDHGFSFPVRYFEEHDLPLNWDAFLDDFHRHWPTDTDDTYVDFIRTGALGMGAKRQGDTRWRRECERRCRAKSVFHFDVQGSVAKSTHAGIPWLRHLRRQLGDHVHVWPFDGWDVSQARCVVFEAYPALYKSDFAPEDRSPDQHDAYSIAMWLRRADADASLQALLQPSLSAQQQDLAQVEGWILGVE